MRGDEVLCKNWYLFGETKLQAPPQSRNVGFFFELSDGHARPFPMGVPPEVCAAG